MIALALSFFGAISASAQSWTASSVQAGNFVLYNVGSGRYFTRGNGWTTQASITESENQGDALRLQLEAVGSNFKIRTDVNGTGYGVEHLSGGTIYTDQSRGKNSSWTFTQVGTDNGPVYTIMSADNHVGGAGKYMSANSSNTIVDPVDDASSSYAQWKLLQVKSAQEIADDAVAAKTATLAALPSATPSSPIDATPVILDANFDIALLQSNWTVETTNSNLQGGSSSNPCAESWRAAFTISQTITGLPEGTFVLKAQAALTDYAGLYNGADYPVVFANEVTTPFIDMEEADRGTSMTQLSGSFSAGKYEVAPITVVVGEDGVLTVGVKGTRTDTWAIWDNFRLTFYGFDQSALVAAYKNALAEAQGIEGLMSKTAAQELADAISTYSSVDESSKDAVRAALNALKTANANAKQSIEDYKAIAKELDNIPSGSGKTTLNNKYQQGDFASLDDFYVQLRSVILGGLGSDDNVDITAVILNPTPVSNADHWTVKKDDGTAGNVNVFDPGNNNAEFWNQSGYSIEQTIPGLPEGTYTLYCTAFTRDGMTATLSVSDGASASVNLVTIPNTIANSRAQAKDYFNGGGGQNALTFNIVGSPKDVTIKLKADNTTGDHWIVWRDFRLVYQQLMLLVPQVWGSTTVKLASGSAIAAGDVVAANAAKISNGVQISFPGTQIQNAHIHPCAYQAKGKIWNKTDDITYIVRSNGYYHNGYNPDWTISFGAGLFGWGDNALADYAAWTPSEGNKVGSTVKAKEYEVTLNEVAFVDFEMDAIYAPTGYEVNVVNMPFQWGTYTVPDADNTDMTAEDYQQGNYIWNMFVEYYTAKHGGAPTVSNQDVDALLEQERYRQGWKAGDAYVVNYVSTYPTTNPYPALTDDEVEYIRFFLATYCEGVILQKNDGLNITVPFTFTINTDASVKQDAEKITRDQVVTAWDVKGNQVTDLLFEPSVETRIEGIEAGSANTTIYNLAGQRVQTARQGIFVVNGKKVVLK